MTYCTLDLPDDPALRVARIAFERALGGHLYQRADGSVVLARETWPPMTRGLTPLPSIPGDWIELTS